MQEAESLGVFLLALGCQRVSLWASCTCHPPLESILYPYMQNVSSLCFLCWHSHHYFFFSSFWVLGRWNYPLMREIYTDLGREFVWTWVCNDISYVHGCVCLTGGGIRMPHFGHWEWERVGLQLQLRKEGTDFQKNHARDLLFMRCLSLMHLLHKPSLFSPGLDPRMLRLHSLLSPIKELILMTGHKRCWDKIGERDCLCMKKEAGWGKLHGRGDIWAGLQGSWGHCALQEEKLPRMRAAQRTETWYNRLSWEMSNSLMCLEYTVSRKVVRDETGNIFGGHFHLDGLGGWSWCYLKLFCQSSLELHGISWNMANAAWSTLQIIRSLATHYFPLTIRGMYS